jgi:hypothetical protein
VYRASSIQLFSAEFGKCNEDSLSVSTTALNEPSFLHSRQLMREPAFIPGHHAGQGLLPHLTFAKGSETTARFEPCCLGPVSTDHVNRLDKLSEPKLNFPAQYLKIAPSFSNAGATVNGIESTLLPFAPKDLEDHY